MSMFLTPEDVAELTGIRNGRAGQTRAQRQIQVLRAMKIPHYVNAVGRPIVARAVIEGAPPAPAPPTWEPAILKRVGSAGKT